MPKVAISLAAFVALLAVTRPWTIRPIATPPGVFDAKGYVDAIWEGRVVPEAERSAVDIHTLPQASGQSASATVKSVFVKATGRIVAVDLGSAVGLARVAVDGAPGLAADVQIGPVVRGSAIRDALPFVHFSDFINQLDFANVASALNARALAVVRAHGEPGALKGRTVTLVGAAAPPSGGHSVEITPVVFDVGGGQP